MEGTNPQTATRRRRLPLLIGLVVLVLALAGAGLWWFVLRDTAPPPAALPPSSGAPAGPATLDGTWQVTPGPDVFVGYRIHEIFGGDALSRTAVGRTPAMSGTLTIAGTEVRSASVSADLTRLTSDEGRRDRYLRTAALETAAFPTATFRLTEPIPLSTALAPGQVQHVPAKGELTLHGVTRRVEIPLDARWDGSTIAVSGGLQVALGDYGVVRPDIGGLVSVDPSGRLELQLVFAKT